MGTGDQPRTRATDPTDGNSFLVTGESRAQQDEDDIQRILILLHQEIGSDFSGYRPDTLRRRIRRHMAMLKMNASSQYIVFAQAHPEDLQQLSKDILISVTAFFRDPEAFTALDRILAKIMEKKKSPESIRIWVPACATGEEAYSIALLIANQLGKAFEKTNLQIFGTDIDDESIDQARRGFYPADAMAGVEARLREKFFTRGQAGYQVGKILRERVVFARQDVIKDPPFSRLDLISCRNLLIYFQSQLQKRVIPIFHYALNPQGYLFLGKSETVGSHTDLFSAEDKRWRIFRRKGSLPALPAPRNQRRTLVRSRTMRAPEPSRPANFKEVIHRSLADLFGPPAVLIDEHWRVMHIRGDISPFLRFGEGDAKLTITDLVAGNLRTGLRNAIQKAQRDQCLVVSRKLRLNLKQQDERIVHLHVKPVHREDGEPGEFIMVAFECHAGGSGPPLPVSPEGDLRDQRIVELEQELAGNRDHLQATTEELESANEELQSLNEELQSANEELQSSNEELETSNEELQATNEELTTVNEELQRKTGELYAANADLENILKRVGLAMIVVDQDLRVKRFTPPATALFSLMTGDQGQVLTAVARHLELPNLRILLRRAILEGDPAQEDIDTGTKIYEMKIFPYYDETNRISGAVLTFYDKTAVQRREQEFRALAENAPDIVARFDRQLRHLYINRSALIYCDETCTEFIGKTHRDLGMPEEFCRLWEDVSLQVFQTGRENRFEFRMASRNGQRFFESRLSPEFSPDGSVRTILAISRDITHRVRAENSLRRSEARFRRIVDTALEGIWEVDGGFRTTYANQQMADMLGYRVDELLGRSLWDFVAGDPADKKELEARQRQGVRETIEIQLHHRVGHLIWGRMSAAPILDDTGALVGAFAMITDITQIRNNAEALAASEERFRLAVMEAPHPVMVFAEDGQILLLNRAWSEVSGFAPEDLPNLEAWSARAFGRQKPMEPGDIDRLFQLNRSREEGEHPITTAAGQERIWNFTSAPLGRLPDGRRMVVTLATDVTERKHYEAQLEQTNRTLEAAQQMARLGYWYFSVGKQTMIWSDQMYAIMGRESTTPPALPAMRELFHPEDRPAWDAAIERVANGQGHYDLILRIVFPDRSIHYVNARGYPRNHAGSVAGLYGIVLDITAIKQAEQTTTKLEAQLRQAQKLEAIGTVAGGVAHDFNNILGIILGNAELAAEEPGQGPKLQEHLDEIINATLRAKEIVRQLLSFSRQSESEPQPIDLRHTVDEFTKLLKAAIPADIELRHNVNGSRHTVLADSGQVHQVLMNLCTNSAHAMETRGGILTIDLETIDLEAAGDLGSPELKPGPYVLLRVSDSGHGIDPAILHRIFDPYFTTKEVNKGSGLGLAVVHGIVQRHSAVIVVESTVGSGTTFEIYFPRVSQVPAAAEPVLPMPTGAESILLVDDEPSLVKMGCQLLERLGYQVTKATNGAEALALFENAPQHFDLVITDMAMPEMGGDVLAARLKSIRADLPILLCSGYSEKMDAAKAQAMGFGYFEKPLDVRRLANLIRAVLDRT